MATPGARPTRSHAMPFWLRLPSYETALYKKAVVLAHITLHRLPYTRADGWSSPRVPAVPVGPAGHAVPARPPLQARTFGPDGSGGSCR